MELLLHIKTICNRIDIVLYRYLLRARHTLLPCGWLHYGYGQYQTIRLAFGLANSIWCAFNCAMYATVKIHPLEVWVSLSVCS